MALERGFTTLQPIKLVPRETVWVNLTSRRWLEDPAAGAHPLPPYGHLILAVRTLVATSFKQRPVERTTKQLYTYFMESDIVFRIAIVHATDLETAFDRERYDRAGEILSTSGGYGRYESPKILKRPQTANDM